MFWSMMKKLINTTWLVTKAVMRMSARVMITIANHLSLGLPDLLFGFLTWPEKKLRLHICILSTNPATPDQAPSSSSAQVASKQSVQNAIKRTQRFYKEFFNIKIIPYQKTFIEVIRDPAPTEVLNIRCGICFELGMAGAYFAKHLAGWRVIPLSFTFPITVFVIENLTYPSIGCSMSVLSDYIVIDPQGLRDELTLAHEIGHACSLWHSGDPTNFMHKMALTSKKNDLVSKTPLTLFPSCAILVMNAATAYSDKECEALLFCFHRTKSFFSFSGSNPIWPLLFFSSQVIIA